MTYAEYLARKGRYELAALHLRKAVEQRPSFAEAWNNLGGVEIFTRKDLPVLDQERHLGS